MRKETLDKLDYKTRQEFNLNEKTYLTNVPEDYIIKVMAAVKEGRLPKVIGDEFILDYIVLYTNGWMVDKE